jgi:hypothetical protein
MLLEGTALILWLLCWFWSLYWSCSIFLIVNLIKEKKRWCCWFCCSPPASSNQLSSTIAGLERLGDCSRTSATSLFSLEYYTVAWIYLMWMTYPSGNTRVSFECMLLICFAPSSWDACGGISRLMVQQWCYLMPNLHPHAPHGCQECIHHRLYVLWQINIELLNPEIICASYRQASYRQASYRQVRYGGSKTVGFYWWMTGVYHVRKWAEFWRSWQSTSKGFHLL